MPWGSSARSSPWETPRGLPTGPAGLGNPGPKLPSALSRLQARLPLPWRLHLIPGGISFCTTEGKASFLLTALFSWLPLLVVNGNGSRGSGEVRASLGSLPNPFNKKELRFTEDTVRVGSYLKDALRDHVFNLQANPRKQRG